MKKSFKKILMMIVCCFITNNAIISSDAESEPTTPVNQKGPELDQYFRPTTGFESSGNPSQGNPSPGASNPSQSTFLTPSIVLNSSVDGRFGDSPFVPQLRTGILVSTSASACPGACTPPQSPVVSKTDSLLAQSASVVADSEIDQILSQAQIENQQIVQLIKDELLVLRNSKTGVVDVACWKNLFSGLKNIKDSPQKPNVRHRTIVAICRIVAKEAFAILKQQHQSDAEQIKSMFDAMQNDQQIEAIMNEAQELFDLPTKDLTELPAWIVKTCFEKVEQYCQSPVAKGDSYQGLRSEVKPLIRSFHIGHGHIFDREIDGNNVGEFPVLMDPTTGAVSLVWKKLDKVKDDGSCRMTEDGEAIRKLNIRKTIFPIGMRQPDVVLSIERAIQGKPLGASKLQKCVLKIFKDPNTGLNVQMNYNAGGAFISTAYPVRIINWVDWIRTQKPVFVMRRYESMQDLLEKPQGLGRKTDEDIHLLSEEIKSYVAMSDRIIADCGETVIVDIGHINPLYTMLLGKKPNVSTESTTPSKAASPKGKKGSVDQESLYAATYVVSARTGEYCPIGVEVPRDCLQKNNPKLYEKLEPFKLTPLAAPVRDQEFSDDERLRNRRDPRMGSPTAAVALACDKELSDEEEAFLGGKDRKKFAKRSKKYNL